MTQNIMGFKTEVNYILKSSSQDESKNLYIEPGMSFKIKKDGLRTYVINASIMFADCNWNILGMCVITESKIVSVRGVAVTEVIATVLTRFTLEETAIVSRLVIDAEKARSVLQV